MAQRFCMNCGKPLREQDKFCMNCGAPAGGTSPAAAPLGVPRPPQHATPATRPVPTPAPQPPARKKTHFWNRKNRAAQATAPVATPVPPAVPRRPAATPSPMPVTQPAPSRTGAFAPTSAPAGWGDESTTVLAEPAPALRAGDDEATTVLAEAPRVTLVRERTGERMELALPAVVGKGSAATCKISGNTAISRQHVRIAAEETTGVVARVTAEDMGSLNKTRLNGDLLVKGKPRALLDGDKLMLADETFVVHVTEV